MTLELHHVNRQNANPLAGLTFPVLTSRKKLRKAPSFSDELVTSLHLETNEHRYGFPLTPIFNSWLRSGVTNLSIVREKSQPHEDETAGLVALRHNSVSQPIKRAMSVSCIPGNSEPSRTVSGGSRAPYLTKALLLKPKRQVNPCLAPRRSSS